MGTVAPSLKCALTALIVLIACWNLPGRSMAVPRDVLIDTAALTGVAATLVFDLVDGDGVANNSVGIASFLTDGVLGTAASTGGVSGSLIPGPLILSDTDFFNELLQSATLGSFIRFTVDVTGRKGGGPLPDSFSFFILGPGGGTLVTSNDPSGANALFEIDLVGPPLGSIVTVFSAVAPSGASVPVIVTSVPLPALSVLITSGLLLLIAAETALLSRWPSAKMRS